MVGGGHQLLTLVLLRTCRCGPCPWWWSDRWGTCWGAGRRWRSWPDARRAQTPRTLPRPCRSCTSSAPSAAGSPQSVSEALKQGHTPSEASSSAPTTAFRREREEAGGGGMQTTVSDRQVLVQQRFEMRDRQLYEGQTVYQTGESLSNRGLRWGTDSSIRQASPCAIEVRNEGQSILSDSWVLDQQRFEMRDRQLYQIGESLSNQQRGKMGHNPCEKGESLINQQRSEMGDRQLYQIG